MIAVTLDKGIGKAKELSKAEKLGMADDVLNVADDVIAAVDDLTGIENNGTSVIEGGRDISVILFLQKNGTVISEQLKIRKALYDAGLFLFVLLDKR